MTEDKNDGYSYMLDIDANPRTNREYMEQQEKRFIETENPIFALDAVRLSASVKEPLPDLISYWLANRLQVYIQNNDKRTLEAILGVTGTSGRNQFAMADTYMGQAQFFSVAYNLQHNFGFSGAQAIETFHVSSLQGSQRSVRTYINQYTDWKKRFADRNLESPKIRIPLHILGIPALAPGEKIIPSDLYRLHMSRDLLLDFLKYPMKISTKNKVNFVLEKVKIRLLEAEKLSQDKPYFTVTK